VRPLLESGREQEARRLGIPVLTPKTLKTPEALEEFSAHDADAAACLQHDLHAEEQQHCKKQS
jgi:methionyl-tRNA formyltransferase